MPEVNPDDESLGWFPSVTTYFGYGVLMGVGYVLNFIDMLMGYKDKGKKGYAPLFTDFEAFWRTRLYTRIHDCWNRPVKGCAGATMKLMERNTESPGLDLTGIEKDVVNLSSYNYLGFAVPGGPNEPAVLKALDTYGVSTCASPLYGGVTEIHRQLEDTIAEFMNVESSMVFGMGWGTNSTAIPSLVGKGCLIISDNLNHSSIVTGARSSDAHIRVFQHNDVAGLEKLIRNSIAEGQPYTHRPWKKILIIVEGIYSMEGETCELKPIVELKKKYGCYLYLDEAHSIGALGPTGRGICEYAGVDHNDIDILMGTFTKSFGAIGGYVAGKKQVIDGIRKVCASSIYSAGLSPPCAAQVLDAFHVIMGKDGTTLGKRKLKQLIENSNYFRKGLEDMGVQVLGDYDSAVIPVMVANPAKLPAVSRECLKRGLAVVVVGFPATPILTSRVRFCISAGHTRDQLDHALKGFGEVAELCHLKYVSSVTG